MQFYLSTYHQTGVVETSPNQETNVSEIHQVVPCSGDNFQNQASGKNLSLVGKFQGHFLNLHLKIKGYHDFFIGHHTKSQDFNIKGRLTNQFCNKKSHGCFSQTPPSLPRNVHRSTCAF